MKRQDLKEYIEILLQEADEFELDQLKVVTEKVPRYSDVRGSGPYDQFSHFGPNPHYDDLAQRSVNIITKNFKIDSPTFRAIAKVIDDGISIEGKKLEAFERSKTYIVHALTTALKVCENDRHSELIDDPVPPQPVTNFDPKKIFIVHGHDEPSKDALYIFLTSNGLVPIVLNMQENKGQTIIEKLEANSDVGFAIILLTPDDDATGDDKKKEKRARQNVIFEWGFFIAKLGRKNVCCLRGERGGRLKIPSDLDGMIDERFKKHVKETFLALQKELKAAGYEVK